MADLADRSRKGIEQIVTQIEPTSSFSDSHRWLPTRQAEYEAEKIVPGCRGQRVLKPGACIDLDNQVPTARAVEQNFHFTDAEVIERIRRPAGNSCGDGVRI